MYFNVVISSHWIVSILHVQFLTIIAKVETLLPIHQNVVL